MKMGRQMNAQLLVVGRRDANRLTGVAAGGLTGYLVNNGPTTVAVVPPGQSGAQRLLSA